MNAEKVCTSGQLGRIRNMWKLIFILSLMIFFYSIAAHAAIIDLGTYGNTYKISDPDILSEIEERVNDPEIQKKATQGLQKALDNYSHPMKIQTAWASKDAIHYVDPTYTLPYDIPNGFGGYMYKKGYKINPLHHMVFDQTIFIIDPGDKRQLLWLKKQFETEKNIKPMVLLSFGNMVEYAHKFPFPVYAMTKDLSKFFKIKEVPAKITQAGDLMKIEIFDPEEKK